MDEIDFLRKINLVFKHNQINRLKKENEQKDKKIELISKEGKRIFDEIIEVISSLADIHIKISPEEAENYSLRWAESVPKNFISSPGSLTCEEAKAILASL